MKKMASLFLVLSFLFTFSYSVDTHGFEVETPSDPSAFPECADEYATYTSWKNTLHDYMEEYGVVDSGYVKIYKNYVISHDDLMDCIEGGDYVPDYQDIDPRRDDEDHCTNNLKDEDETGIDCGGSDCEDCEEGIRLIPPEGFIDADGETRFIIFADLRHDGQPKEGEILYFTLNKELGVTWNEEIGELAHDSDVTNSDGRARIEYVPPFIITAELEDDTPIEIAISAKKEGWLGPSATGSYTIKPLDLNVSVEKIVPVQALASLPSNKIPMVAGKKTAVMVAVKASKPDVFWPHENIRFFLDFDAKSLNEHGWEEGGFEPLPSYRIMLEEPSPSIEVIEGDSVNEYLSLMQIEKEERKTYKVYIFYLDSEKTDLKGHYTFEAKIMFKKFDPSKEKELGGKKAKVKVYPSEKLRLKIVPIGLGVWNPDVCDFCVKERWYGGYEFVCTDGHQANYQIGNIFDWEWEGRLDIDKVNAALQNARGPKAKTCKEGFAQYYPQSVLRDLSIRSPATATDYPGARNNPMTPEQRYHFLVDESLEYFKAVMPIAEEDLTYEIVGTPQRLTVINARESWLSSTISALDRKYGNFFTSSHYRIVGVVPVDPARDAKTTGFSLLDMDPEGYMSGVYADESVLINHFYAGTTVMTHEIAHTYCAIDEYENAFMRAIKAGITVPATCAEGVAWINSNRGSGPEGTPVTTGFWVEKRKLMGTPTNPKYSFMGNATVGNRWVTEELYFGIGSNLGTFPFFESSWKED